MIQDILADLVITVFRRSIGKIRSIVTSAPLTCNNNINHTHSQSKYKPALSLVHCMRHCSWSIVHL